MASTFFTSHSFTKRHPAIDPVEVVKPQGPEITVRPERVAIVYQTQQGEAFRALVERKQAETFIRSLSRQIEEKENAARIQIDKDLEVLFDGVFSDQDEVIREYADWFYAWGRTYKLVAGALTVSIGDIAGDAITSVFKMSVEIDPAQTVALAEGHIQGQLLEHYTTIVLKPQHRDPLIENGVKEIIARAYERFLADLDAFDLELVEFLYAQDPNAQSINPNEIVSVELEWDVAKFEGPLNSTNEVVSSAAVGATVLLGSVLFSAEISAVILPIISTIGSNLLATVGFATGGGTIGSGVPVLGTVVGILTGLSADYVINQFRENMTREEFENKIRQGIETTIVRWKGKIGPALHRVNNAWYADVRRWLISDDLAHISND